MQTLTAYTGSSQRVYNYDRNSNFAKVLLKLVMAGSECEHSASIVIYSNVALK